MSENNKKTIALDLGSGPEPKNTFGADIVYGVDVRDDLGPNILKADLAIEGIPWGANFFDFITAHDFIEHIPRLVYLPQRRNSFVELMNEVYRVLKADGLFLSFTPAWPHEAAMVDPTHVNFITQHTFPMYFDNKQRLAKMYGFNGAFEVIKQEWQDQYLLTIMRKVLLPDAD
jgi:SAM-dependent methyltransferase